MRAAVRDFFVAANVPYVGTVFKTREYVHEEDYEQNEALFFTVSPGGSGAILVVNIPDDDRRRIAMTGRGGVHDRDIFRVALEVFLANNSGDPGPAQEDYDTIIDTIKTLVRGNPLLNNSTAIWSAGEFTYGVKHAQSEPYTGGDGTTVFITGVVRFEVYQWDAGPAGTV